MIKEVFDIIDKDNDEKITQEELELHIKESREARTKVEERKEKSEIIE